MPRRFWTVMIVPHGSDAPRTVNVTERMLRVLTATASVAGMVVLMALGLLLTTFGGGPAIGASRELNRELADLRERLSVLQDTINTIGRRDEKLRLLAGLPPVEEEVRAAGIGGPGTPELAADPLYKRDRVLGVLAFGARSDIDGLIRRANVLAASFAEVTDSLQRNHERLAATPSIMPTAGWLSSNFSRSRRHPILHVARPHEGIDVSAPMGAPIVAPAAGRVIRVAREKGYGNVLEIDHGHGIVTKYAHCSKIVVKTGQRVTRGQVIANVGNSGLSTGPHLHYEIHENGKVIDPLRYVLPEAIPD